MHEDINVMNIEPDSLANMVTNLSVQKCANAQSAYYECINYALKKLNLDNVSMYIDAGMSSAPIIYFQLLTTILILNRPCWLAWMVCQPLSSCSTLCRSLCQCQLTGSSSWTRHQRCQLQCVDHNYLSILYFWRQQL